MPVDRRPGRSPSRPERTIEVEEVSGIGVLRNRVVAEK
jgi:hypothetical protein